jgi:hypothetical protein
MLFAVWPTLNCVNPAAGPADSPDMRSESTISAFRPLVGVIDAVSGFDVDPLFVPVASSVHPLVDPLLSFHSAKMHPNAPSEIGVLFRVTVTVVPAPEKFRQYQTSASRVVVLVTPRTHVAPVWLMLEMAVLATVPVNITSPALPSAGAAMVIVNELPLVQVFFTTV